MHDTCKALILCRYENNASDLQLKLKQLLTLMQKSLDDIWIPEMLTITAAQQFLQGPNIDYTQLQNEQRYAMMGKCIALNIHAERKNKEFETIAIQMEITIL